MRCNYDDCKPAARDLTHLATQTGKIWLQAYVSFAYHNIFTSDCVNACKVDRAELILNIIPTPSKNLRNERFNSVQLVFYSWIVRRNEFRCFQIPFGSSPTDEVLA